MNRLSQKNILKLFLVFFIVTFVGMFCFAFLTNYSVAQGKNAAKTVSFTGKVVDGYSTGKAGVTVNIIGRSLTNESTIATAITEVDGSFSTSGEISDDSTWYLSQITFYKEKSAENMEIGGFQSYVITPTPITETNNLGSLTCSYIGTITPYINNEEALWNEQKQLAENQYGTWNPVVTAQENSGGSLFAFEYPTEASYTISDNTISIVEHYGAGGSMTLTRSFTLLPAGGQALKSITVTPIGLLNGTSITSDLRFDGQVGSNVHTVTIGENISNVKTSDGKIVTSGQEVAHGETLYITPVVQSGCVTKIKVNNSINSTGVTTVNSDLVISASISDAVTISGVVTADNSSTTNGNIDFNNFVVQKAYAAQVGVEGATVTFASTDGWTTSTLTDANGAYTLEVEKGLAGTLTIAKEGYNTYTKEFSAEDLATDITVSSALSTEKPKPTGSVQTGDNDYLAFAFILGLAFMIVASYKFTRKLVIR